MFTHQTQLRVRYSETDQMGYVYYGNYAAYFEVGRVEALRALGMPYRAIEEQGVMLPVRTYEIRYRKPATYDDLLTIETTIPKLPEGRILFTYKCMRGDELLTEASTELVFIDRESMRPTRCPQALTTALSPFFSA